MKAEVGINIVCDTCGSELDYWYGDWSETAHVKPCEQCKKDRWIDVEEKQPIENGYYFIMCYENYHEEALAKYTDGNWEIVQGDLYTYSVENLKWRNIWE